MAVFKLNICKFNNCDLIFNNLENLIRHIETNHINYDPKIIEQFEIQQPTCLPLSYVLKFYADTVEELDETNSKLKQTLLTSKPPTAPQHKLNNNGQFDMPSIETSDQDQVGEKDVSSRTNKILKINTYKAKKSYKCHCEKTQTSGPSFKKHALQCHNAAVITAQVKEIMQHGSETCNELMQPYQSISLKQYSTPEVPLKTLVVSTKPTTNSITSMVDQQQSVLSQRLMIQISNSNNVTSYSS